MVSVQTANADVSVCNTDQGPLIPKIIDITLINTVQVLSQSSLQSILLFNI